MRLLGRSFVLGLISLLAVPSAHAIDHQDAPSLAATPSADIADLFAWMSTDGSKVILAMTVNPGATSSSRFASDTMYVFHTSSRSSIASTTATLVDIVCGFDDAQKISCAVGDASVSISGDASNPSGLARSDNKLRVFAGLRKDPSFASIANIDQMKAAAKTAFATAAAPDAAGCKATTGKTAIMALGSMPASNTFTTSNVLSLVMEVDRSLLNRGGPIFGVWAATHKKAKTN
jgi:hypothetical protein